MTKLEKKCEVCGKAFICMGTTGNCWCEGITIDKCVLKRISRLSSNCLCESCLFILKDITRYGDKVDTKVKTKKGEFRLSLRKNNNKFLIEVTGGGYKYPLAKEGFESLSEAIKMFYQYYIKLQNENFKIIRNIEALDEHYRRVYHRIRYGILF